MDEVKRLNKATKAIFNARSDFWESQYFCQKSERNTRRYAKRQAKRAARRLPVEFD